LVQDGTKLIAYPTASGSVTLPEGITSIGSSAFSDCTGLTQIILPNGLTEIGFNGFLSCTGLTEITLPVGLTVIGSQSFLYCSNLTLIICHATTPPSASGNLPFGIGQSLQFKVPAGSVEAYKAAYGWSQHAYWISALE